MRDIMPVERIQFGLLWSEHFKIVGVFFSLNFLAMGEFSSPGSAVCADSYFGIRSTPMLPQ